MAWERLKTDYKDAVWSGLRKFIPIDNGDGSYSVKDVTQYTVYDESFFGAYDANRINTAVNAIMAALENGTDLYEVFTEFFENQKVEFDSQFGDVVDHFLHRAQRQIHVRQHVFARPCADIIRIRRHKDFVRRMPPVAGLTDHHLADINSAVDVVEEGNHLRHKRLVNRLAVTNTDSETVAVRVKDDDGVAQRVLLQHIAQIDAVDIVVGGHRQIGCRQFFQQHVVDVLRRAAAFIREGEHRHERQGECHQQRKQLFHQESPHFRRNSPSFFHYSMTDCAAQVSSAA